MVKFPNLRKDGGYCPKPPNWEGTSHYYKGKGQLNTEMNEAIRWVGLKHIKKNGYLLFHDIANHNTGVARCWNEIKENHKLIGEFVHPHVKNCGIGVLQIE